MDFQVFKSAAAEEAAKLNIEEYELYCQLEDSVSASAFKREINEIGRASCRERVRWIV